MRSNNSLKCSWENVVLSLLVIDLFKVLPLKCIKLAKGLFSVLVSNIFKQEGSSYYNL